MTDKITYEHGKLTLEIKESQNNITIQWLGKSTDREPALFLAPVLNEVIEKAVTSNKILIMDFAALEYMNSSTITPIVRLLSHLDKSLASVQIFYNKNLRWQALNFSALQVLNTRDPRIVITGV